jgi:hypothetical protein
VQVALSESARPVFSALVRPLVWLAIFATGFQNWGACLDCRVKPGNEG